MNAGELGEVAADVGVRDLPRLRVVLQVLCQGREAAVTTTEQPAARQRTLGLSQALSVFLETPNLVPERKKMP